MTYLQFHLAFVVPLILALTMVPSTSVSIDAGARRFRALVLIIGAALVATSPWDNYLVYRGVWSYGADRVLGTIGFVPFEEYLFFVLQPVLAGLVYFLLRSSTAVSGRDMPGWFRAAGVAFWLSASAAGLVMLASGVPRFVYLGLILAWASPLLAGLMHLGASHVWADRRAVALGITLATLYLSLADGIAIHFGIWSVSNDRSTGIHLGALPLEEASFFLVTTTLCVVGLALLLPTRTLQNKATLSTA